MTINLLSPGTIVVGVLLLFILYVALFTGKDKRPVPAKRKGGEGMLSLFVLLLLLGVAALLLWPTIAALAHQMTTFSSRSFSGEVSKLSTPDQELSPSDQVTGDPDLSASFIERVLTQANSPARGLGQTLVDQGKAYHIRPSFALAVFHHESAYGTRGVATVTKSLGNIRCAGWSSCVDGFRAYGSWSEGASDFYDLIAHAYVSKGRDTVAAIFPVYAPAGDGNNVDGYIQSVRTDMQRYQRGEV